ncbi:hypothetical protein [Bacteroides sp.]|uniref:hypothetical protein n=1 Tax=Bacteroides sp. TaxID=29523 RepID=UPI0026049F0B|nr:hypothetical protein [Bacteroides sp.]MDD3041299.1 hypothetical protein [Bacteroides sp.]
MREIYINAFKSALSEIEECYYHVRTTYCDEGIVRERVFCYELYHKLRSADNDRRQLSLSAEIDKRGHIGFAPSHQANPDFVLHNPGTFKNNEVVVEVKGKMVKDGVIKDLRTLDNFLSLYNYRYGFFILYNYSIQQLKHRLILWARNGSFDERSDKFKDIIVFCKQNAKTNTEVSTIGRLLGDIVG